MVWYGVWGMVYGVWDYSVRWVYGIGHGGGHGGGHGIGYGIWYGMGYGVWYMGYGIIV